MSNEAIQMINTILELLPKIVLGVGSAGVIAIGIVGVLRRECMVVARAADGPRIGFVFFWRLIEDASAWEEYRPPRKKEDGPPRGQRNAGWKHHKRFRIYGIFWGSHSSHLLQVGSYLLPTHSFNAAWPGHRRYVFRQPNAQESPFRERGIQQTKLLLSDRKLDAVVSKNDMQKLVTKACRRTAPRVYRWTPWWRARQLYPAEAFWLLGEHETGFDHWFESNKHQLRSAIEKRLAENA